MQTTISIVLVDTPRIVSCIMKYLNEGKDISYNGPQEDLVANAKAFFTSFRKLYFYSFSPKFFSRSTSFAYNFAKCS